MAKSNQFALAPDTKIKLVATHKHTFINFEKVITYAEWVNFVKHKNYYYLTYKI
jgi:hypothetical protein